MTEICPVCNAILELKNPLRINQSIICSDCGLELEVIWLYPLELAKVLSYNPDRTRQTKNLKKRSAKK